MTCNNRSRENSHDRLLAQQEHRQISRLWKKAIEKQSSPDTDLIREFEDINGLGVNVKNRFSQKDLQFKSQTVCEPNEEKKNFPSESIQKKLLKGKAIPKIKSPLQKFDEIVSRELSSRRALGGGGRGGGGGGGGGVGGGGGGGFEGSNQWSGLPFTGISDFGRNKISPENKVSRGALHGMEKEVREFDPSNAENPALMDAIEKLAQAQAFCRFDAAVKAAEAATASVPPEMAEEVAMACAKDYQSDIVDIINEKICVSEERKPIEVIGYIGVTKLKDNL